MSLVPEQQSLFAAAYNQSSFPFDHRLHELDLFDIAQLRKMAERLPDPAYYSTVKSSVEDGWKKTGEHRPTLAETLETLSQTDSLVLLKHCEKDPIYGEVFRRLMDDVVAHVGEALRADLEIGRATLIISSPHRITSYHIDSEVNFLLQVRGHKLLYTFDPNDRSILTDPELEAFYAGDWDGAQYRRERQDEARTFPLKPGSGVHLPLHAPHWAQNLDDVSVGVSLNFNLRSGARLAKLYKVNNRLRQAGLQPTSPGVSGWQDSLKLAALAVASRARPLVPSRNAKA